MSKIDAKTKLRIWMLKKGIRVGDVQKHMGLAAGCVSHFLAGRMASKKIVNYFTNKRCPESYFKNGRVV